MQPLHVVEGGDDDGEMGAVRGRLGGGFVVVTSQGVACGAVVLLWRRQHTPHMGLLSARSHCALPYICPQPAYWIRVYRTGKAT